MITIFTIPKPFKGHIEIIQNNAIRSWRELKPECEIILFGDDEGVEEAANKFGVQHFPDVKKNEFGTPLLDFVFNKAYEIAEHDVLCYVNADIILMSDLLKAVNQIQKYFFLRKSFLLVGLRRNVDLNWEWDFSKPNWDVHLNSYIIDNDKFAPGGMDYFAFTRGLFCNIPPFAVGRPGWDNWMVYQARFSHIPVIDCTKVINAIHQNHNYTHIPSGTGKLWEGPEAKINMEILGEGSGFRRSAATWILTPKGLRLAITIDHIRGYEHTLPILHPKLWLWIKPIWNLLEKIRRVLWLSWNKKR
jgi:hypothetical protein